MLATPFRDKVARQIALEDESRALGIERYRKNRPLPWRDAVSTQNEEAELPPGRTLLKLTVEPVAQAIQEFVERINSGGAGRRPIASKVLGMVEPEEAAYLTGRVVVNAAVMDASLQAAAFEVAEALVHHAEMRAMRQANKAGYKGIIKQNEKVGRPSAKRKRAQRDILSKEGAAIELTQTEKLHTGVKAIELFCDTTGLFTLEDVPAPRGTRLTLRPTEACRQWLERQHARCEVLEPLHMPMVVRPRRWRTPNVGGYLRRVPNKRMVKQWSPAFHEELRWVDMDEVYRSLNNVQDTPWRINTRILDVMRQVWDGGGSLGGLPRREDIPMPAKPADIEQNPEAVQKWKAEAARTHTANAQLLSKRLAVSQRLWLATKFKDEEALYFPHEFDFRGRIYPTPVSGPHPQGDDSAKALLEFADGMPLGTEGVNWLAIHIANLFGVDKVSFEERIEWTWANSEAIVDSAYDPLDGRRFWTTADSPYSALAACFEWAGYIREGEGFVSHLPVALDGSNSGLQHFSAMLRDPVGAAAVNLIPSEKPQDVYMQVATAAQRFVDADESGPPPPPDAIADDPRKVAEYEADWRAARDAWKNGRITRKIAKRPCMTYCYSATRFGMQGMILQTLREIDRENDEAGKPPHLMGADNYKAAMYLSHVLWEAISEVVSAASEAMAWLRDVAKIASEASQPVWWTTPMGLPVLQAYRASSSKQIDIHWGGRRIQPVLRQDSDTIDKRAQANGIAPNFVHSLDAAHLQRVVNACADAGIRHLALIHDSFGTHAANAGLLSRLLRSTFVEQYTPNVLEQFRQELIRQLPADLAARVRPIPPLGSLDLSVVEESAYVFA
ncbi:MAG: T3/T7 RNA polymerase [Brevundimonas sp.]|jgi:DNA-directed RNA polymerase, mitochondrial|nr:MAG: T3/T7 RNA polymerase [Brevundimonas sp.]